MTMVKTVRTVRGSLLAGVLAALAACGGTAAPAKNQASAGPSTQASMAGDRASDARTTCVASFVRQRTCTDQFLPALLDARIRLDRPAGIAAEAQQHGKDGLLAQAREEWATDSTDEAIAGRCDQILAALPSEPVARSLEQAAACLAEATCDGFVACELPIVEAMMAR